MSASDGVDGGVGRENRLPFITFRNAVRRLYFATRSLLYTAYYRIAALNYERSLYATRKRVQSRSYRSYDPIHVHGSDWLLTRLLDACEPGDVVVDVGANTGVYALSVATERPTSRVHAFEPDPDTATKLRTNVARNGFEDRISVHELGLAAEPGTAPLHVSTYPELHSFNRYNAERWDARVVETLPIRLDSLDSLIERGAVAPPDHLKVDVEGFEAEVLQGAERTLVERQPIVYVEPHETGDGASSATEVERLLHNHGYGIEVEGDAWVARPDSDGGDGDSDADSVTRDDADSVTRDGGGTA